MKTGEVLVLASKPDYDLNDFAPRLSTATAQQIHDQGAWLNRALDGIYPPASTFKVITALAGLRNGWITPETTANCAGSMRIGGHTFTCDNGDGHHGVIAFREAIAQSCDIYFYTYGIQTGADLIAAEGPPLPSRSTHRHRASR